MNAGIKIKPFFYFKKQLKRTAEHFIGHVLNKKERKKKKLMTRFLKITKIVQYFSIRCHILKWESQQTSFLNK